MKQHFRIKILSAVTVGILAALMVVGTVARADHLYRWDTGVSTERFNNSEGVETEDNWVANAFEVVAAGTRLVSIQYTLGELFAVQPATLAVYQGIDISDPSAGGGLVRIHTTETTITGIAGSDVNLAFDTPVDLQVGDVFYAAILIRGVTGAQFPFHNEGVLPQGHSFFDIGPKQGAPYDLDNTANATVLGAVHPLMAITAQSAGNLFLRVNATDTPL